MTNRKLIIFGATGSLGRVITQLALDKGYQVTAFTRNRSNIEIQHDKLSIVQGDVLNAAQVSSAVESHDVVLCALGAGRNGKLREAGTQNILSAMQANDVSRLICQTTLGAGDSYDNLNFFWKHIMFGMLLRPAFADHQLQEQAILNSSLDWTIVRPAAFTDGALTEQYQVGFDGTAKNLKLQISRLDVADFMLKQIGADTYVRKAVGLSY